MPDDISLACSCGQFQAVIRGASERNGNHVMCYCTDCQAFARHLKQDTRVMDADGGTEIFQVRPSMFDIVAGEEHLSLLRLSPKGLFRWYAGCCATPLCNTASSPKIAFTGVLAANMHPPLDALGPVRFRHKPEHALRAVDAPRGSLLWFMTRTIRQLVGARLSGSWRDTPFFEANEGQSVANPYVLTEEERKAAYTV